MKKRITYKKMLVCVICCLLLLCSGCIYDNMDDCEDEKTCIRFNFLYDYNMMHTDLFAEQVDHITLIICTETGLFETILEIYRQDMEQNHTVSLMLSPGVYTAIAWGNCNTVHYRIHSYETVSGMQLQMTCIENNIMTRANPGSLFHASNTFQVIEGNEDTVPMELIKNSNQVKVVIKGLTEEDRQDAEARFALRLTSNNWSYNYDNSISSRQAITYIPERNPDEDIPDDPNDISIAFTFYPLRLFTYDRETELSLRYRDPQTGREAALTKPLVPYLLNQKDKSPENARLNDEENEYLDREDTYEVIFILGSKIDGSIEIKEWDGVSQPGDL